MTGVVMARIWNTSKSPAESAWLVASSSATTQQVHAAADIAGWLNGETVQIGDPTGTTPGRVIALDISPMLQNLFGAVFPQTGIVLKGSLVGGAGDSLALTANGASGSFVTAARYGAGDGVAIIPCSQLSPVSDSNLVFVREEVATTATTEIVSSIAVLV